MDDNPIIKFREAAETRVSRLDYLELLIHAHINVVQNLLLKKELITEKELFEQIAETFYKRIENLKKEKSTVSPFVKYPPPPTGTDF